MKTSSKFERLYYGMDVYSISDSDGHTVELPPGLRPEEEALAGLLASGWGSEADRKLVGARLIDLAKEAKIAEINAYDKSEAVDGFILDNAFAWLDRDTRGGLSRRLCSEEAKGREITTLWLGTQCYTLPIPLAKKLLDIIELYAADCFDTTARHRAAVLALSDIEAVRSYDHTAGYPEHPVINTQV